jgi:plastocyanin
MNNTVRDRVLFPIVVPVGILAGIALVLFVFSRILLNVPRGVAVAVALLAGLNVLITCAIVSIRRVQGFAVLVLVVVVALPMLVGGAAAAKVFKVHGPSKPACTYNCPSSAPAGPQPFKLSAANVAFSTNTINLQEQNGDATIVFTNNDSVPHNVHIFNGADATAPSLFVGTITQGGQTSTYNVTGLKPGTYFFHCDVHPTVMTGKVVVTAYSGSGSAASANNVTITAANTAYSKTSLNFTANQPITIKFVNNDSVPHNIHIFQGTSATGASVFAGTIAQGGQSVTYSIPALPAGSYYFHCDVHPTIMTGTITVS